jgi:hypothetical protein
MVLMPLVALELLLLFALYLILRVDVVLWTISILTALHECGSMVVGLALMSMSSLISFAIGSASGRLSARAMPLSKLQGSSPISLALSVHVHCIRLYGGKNKYLLKLKISPVVARSGKSTDGPPSRSFQKLFAYVSDIEATQRSPIHRLPARLQHTSPGAVYRSTLQHSRLLCSEHYICGHAQQLNPQRIRSLRFTCPSNGPELLQSLPFPALCFGFPLTPRPRAAVQQTLTSRVSARAPPSRRDASTTTTGIVRAHCARPGYNGTCQQHGQLSVC